MILIILMLISGCSNHVAIVDDWYNEYRVVAHAMGGIDNYDYTNSLEAFNYHYDNGTRVFEVDVLRTSNNDFALVHDWNQYRTELTNVGDADFGPVSTETFVNTLIHDKYRALLLDDLLTLMHKYRDFYVIIDSKTFTVEQTRTFYNDFVDKILEFDAELLKRFIPQAYTPEIYDEIQSLEIFDDIIFTLYGYYHISDGQKIYEIIKEKNIKIIVMHMNDDWAKRVITDIREYAKYDNNYDNLRIYIHTINDIQHAQSIMNDEGFTGVYSDYITENMFR